MQRRKFIRVSSLSVAASVLPGLVSRVTGQIARLEPKMADPKARVQVPRWRPQDFPFTSKAANENPFAVMFSAEVTGPNGVRMTVPGFYDGQGTWKVRFAPNTVGKWFLRTTSTHPDLDNRRASFSCTPNNNRAVHGGLRVDPEHRSQFLYEDGSRYFPMGYECDWLWALDSGDPHLKTLESLSRQDRR